MKKFVLIYFLFLLFLGCTQESLKEDAKSKASEKLEFEVGFFQEGQTKVATDLNFNSSWEEGDQIGLFAVKHAANNPNASLQASNNYLHNLKLTYTGGSWEAEAYHPNDGDLLDFYAYYPYIDTPNLNPLNIVFSVAADQTKAAYNRSDLLTSSKVANITKGMLVSLFFKHKLSLIQLEVPTNYNLLGSGPNSSLTLQLTNVALAGSLNLNTNRLVASSEKKTVKMHRLETNPETATTYTYRVLIPSQAIISLASLTYTQDNRNYRVSFPSLPDLRENTLTRYRIPLPAYAVQTVTVEKGTFAMGSPSAEDGRFTNEQLHTVQLTQDFHISKYLITNAQYAAFLNDAGVGANGLYKGLPIIQDSSIAGRNPWGLAWRNTEWIALPGYENHPVIYVSWYGAKALADWVGGSLPTEAQWEYATRATSTLAYTFGGLVSALANYAWYQVNSRVTTHIVGTRLPNKWGLYDVHGNVWEWCSDWYAEDYYTTGGQLQIDPNGPATGTTRVMRGGSWNSTPQFCRSAYRGNTAPILLGNTIGFRLVLP